MKKALAILLACIMCLSLIAGCGGGAASGSEPEESKGGSESEAAEPVELEFWIVGNYPDEFYYLGEVLDDFNEEYEGKIHVKIVSMGGDHTDMATKWDLAAANDQMPDLIELNAGATLDKYVEAGVMGNLWDYLGEDEEFIARFPNGALEACSVSGNYGDGNYYGFPTETEIQGWYYNTELFEQVGAEIPTTYEELLAVIETFKSNNILPIVHGCTDNWDIWGYHAWPTRLGMTTEMYEQILAGELKFADCEPMVKTMDYIQGLVDVQAYGPNAASTSNAQSLETFLAGGAAMYCVGSWKMAAMEESEIADKIAFNFGPEFKDGVLDGPSGVKPYSWCIAYGKSAVASPEKAAAVAELSKWIVSEDRAKVEIEEYGHFPAVIVDVEKVDLGPVGKMTSTAATSDVIPLVEAASYCPTTSGSSFGETWWNVVTGVISGITTADQAIQQMQDWADAEAALS